MRSFRPAKHPSGKIVEGFAILEEDGKTLQFSKEKRPELWAEYEASMESVPAEDKPKRRKKKDK